MGRAALMAIAKEDWAEANRRFQAISHLVDSPGQNKRADVQAVARILGKDTATIYRWIDAWKASGGLLSSLLRAPRSDRGGGRLRGEIEEVVSEQIHAYFLKPERPTIVDLHEQIQIACREKNLASPAFETVRRRVLNLSGRLVMAKRESRKLAREAYEPIKGSFPGADLPLAVYQVDHSPIDVIFVDEVYRRPINRAFMTVVIDSCTRMIAGFCVTFDNPGAMSAGLALTHAILPKEAWLAERNIDATWPNYGVPAKIYADNGKEFRGEMLKRACAEYGIVMENRPKGLPNYGGHVERLFRTVMKRAQNIPGSTFSNVEERGDYDSEGRAIMTLKEFERWFGIFVTKVYHQRRHRGIGWVPPIKLYERFILGSDAHIGIGLPMPIADPQKLRLDFLPSVTRSIQEYGVVIENIHYYSDVLRPWIHARDPKQTDRKRKFIFSVDPRDIGEVYFFDPETSTYFPVPYRDRTRPRMSVWELRAVLKYIAQHPELQPNEATIFDGLAEMRRIEEESAAKSLKARRRQQRRSDSRKAEPSTAAGKRAAPALTSAERLDEEEDVIYEPFDEIEEAP